MSGSSRTCEYVFDPDDPETWGSEEVNKCYLDEDLLNKDGVWTCPHDAENEKDLCVFHLPIERKDNNKVNDKFLRIIKNFKQKSSGNKSQLQFIGGQFGEFTLDTEINIDEIIHFSHSIFYDNINLSQNNLFKSDFSGVEFKNISIPGLKCRHIDFSGAKFNNANLSEVDFSGSTLFDAQLDDVNAPDVTCWSTDFKKADLSDADFSGGGFQGSNLSGAFVREANFSGANFRDAVLVDVNFGKSNLSNANLWFADLSQADLRNANLSETDFWQTDLSDTILQYAKIINSDAQKTDFSDANCWFTNFSESNLEESVFTGANMKRARFCGSNLEECIMSRSTLFNADLRGAKINGAVLGDVRINEDTQFLGHPDNENSSISYTFSSWMSKSRIIYDEKYGETQSTISYLKRLPLSFLLSVYSIVLFTANLVPKESEKNFRNYVRWLGGQIRSLTLEPIEWIRNEDVQEVKKQTDDKNAEENAESDGEQQKRSETETDDNDENQGDSKGAQTDGGNQSKIIGQDDPVDKDKAKSVYRALEELGGKAARSRLQSQAFVRRQDVQKREYKRRAIDGTLRQERVIGAAKYLRAKVARVTLLYGESPWRIVGISGAFVVFVGLLYPFFGWIQPRTEGAEPITWTRILDGEPHLLFESIYFSALTFTTLGMGDYEPVGGGQVLATFNTVFGAILVALLVFVLGRRAAR